jgi:hypothetical protein
MLRSITKFLSLSDSFGFVDVGCPLWQESGSVVYNCCWALPTQSFSNRSPVRLITIFYCLKFEITSNLEGQVPVFTSPRNRVTPRHWNPFQRLLWLTGLQRRYSTRLHTGRMNWTQIYLYFILPKMYNNSVRISQGTHYVSIIKTTTLSTENPISETLNVLNNETIYNVQKHFTA